MDNFQPDHLIACLEKYEFPIYLNGTNLGEDEDYPDSFFTFFNTKTTSSMFYNNVARKIEYLFEINFFSTDTEKVNEMTADLAGYLKSKGYFIVGEGLDIYAGEPTHTGRQLIVKYTKRKG